ncbi:MAG: DUF1460 domain-containing protein, partial [Saprospiraceae bacterium]|nr:DUF1460 domain-containing protein [Saprospiraceae bacterium]
GQSPCTHDLLPAKIIETGKLLIGSKYEASTLEKPGEEQLVYCTDRFDCVTFVEYVLSKSIFQTQVIPTNDSFEKILTGMRYRDGVIDGYGSRIHYFSEWLMHQQKHHTLKDITQESGGIHFEKDIHFMSAHKDKYPKLDSEAALNKIKDSETLLNSRHKYYIPKQELMKSIHLIKDGDIIAITTDIVGLDIVHTGFAVWVGAHLHLLHASETEGQVVISQLPLYDYLMSKKRQTGIMVGRVRM